MSILHCAPAAPEKPLETVDVLHEEFKALGLQGQGELPELTESEARIIEAGHGPPLPSAAGLDGTGRADAIRKAKAFARYTKGVHALPGTGRSALCLSGGGIRSAAFSLGIVQALARRELLSPIDYLSTVSGGGYTGAWLTAWTHRAMTTQQPALGFADVEEQVGFRPRHAADERAPLQWLRQQQKFLSPRASFSSGDLWAPISIFVRDLLLNWLVFIPMLAAFLLVPRAAGFTVELWSHVSADQAPSLRSLVYGHLPRWFGPLPHDLPGSWLGWADTAGAALVTVGFGMAAFFRTNTRLSGRDSAFKAFVLIPVLTGSFLLVMAISGWIEGGRAAEVAKLPEWAVLVPMVLVASRLLVAAANLWLSLTSASGVQAARLWRDAGLLVAELLSLAVAGALTGAVIWVGLVWYKHLGDCVDARTLAAGGVPWLLMAYLAGQVLFAGLTSRLPHGTFDREWLARASGYYILAAVAWLLAAGTVLYGHEVVDATRGYLGSLAAASGTLTVAAGLSNFTKATTAAAAVKERLPVSMVTRLLCLVFCVTAAILLAHWTAQLIAMLPGGVNIEQPTISFLQAQAALLPTDLRDTPAGHAKAALIVSAAACAALLSVSVVAAWIVNVNEFSLHTLYANRLIRTFLGASNTPDITGRDAGRNGFDGFASADNLAMGELWRDAAGRLRREGPLPVVGVALNLVAGDNLAWQERKAAPFVVTPLHTGGDLVGYRDTRQVGGGLTLGMSMAISGAAASPNFGYHSSPLVSFVLMLFNVRLGWWLGNPNTPAKWRQRGPLFSLRLFCQEALGQTSATHPFVYLSDGGHFDNLGLYEMVRRRCRTIVVVDASADPECHLDDLGRTLRSISVDLGVTISFDPSIGFKKRSIPETAGVYCALGRIVYPEAEGSPGTLVFIKAGLYDDAPADVRAYAATNAKFPHDSTLNQWFTESQFESYRALGSHAISAICGEQARPMTLTGLVADVKRHVKTARKAGPGTAQTFAAPPFVGRQHVRRRDGVLP